ncbi:MAG: hypothetical protein HCA05_02125 [Dolichospermum sp. DET68]
MQNRNIELEAEVKKRTGELQAKTERERLVSAIANRIRTSLDLEEILNSLATEVRKVLTCDRFGNWHWFLSHDTVFNRDSNNLPKQIIGAASEISERVYKKSSSIILLKILLDKIQTLLN